MARRPQALKTRRNDRLVPPDTRGPDNVEDVVPMPEASAAPTEWGFGDSRQGRARYRETVCGMVAEARRFIDLEIENSPAATEGIIDGSVDRAYRYYNGKTDIPQVKKGRSRVVMTEVRDTIDRALPQILKTLAASPNIVDFQPRGELSGDYARLQTLWCNFVFFGRNKGFLLLHDFVKHALTAKRGVFQTYYVEEKKVAHEIYNDLTPDERDGILNQEGVELLHEQKRDVPMGEVTPQLGDGGSAPHEAPEDPLGLGQGPLAQELMQKPTPAPPVMPNIMAGQHMMQMGVPDTQHDIRVKRVTTNKKIVVDVVPPEEIIIARDAKGEGDASIIARDCMVTRSKLVELGFDPKIILEIPSTSERSTSTQADLIRRERQHQQAGFNDQAKAADPSSQMLRYVDALVRLDRDGDGIAELRRCCLAGNGEDMQILSDTYADYEMFTFGTVFRIPNSVIGDSMADVTMDLQDINTAIMRGILDNLNFSVIPRVAYVENAVEAEDIADHSPGAGIRMRQIGAVQPLDIPFVGGQMLPVLDHLNIRKERRTGVSDAAAGLNPDALQSSTEVGVRAIVGASAMQMELSARLIAEAVGDMFRKLAKLGKKYGPTPDMITLMNGAELKVDPSKFDPDTELLVNVGLGNGSTETKMQALGFTLQQQQQAITLLSSAGVTPDQNPLANLDNVRNTLQDMLAVLGLKDASRYWQQQPNERMQHISQQLAQNAKQKPDPEMAKAQAEIQAKNAQSQNDMKLAQQRAMSEAQIAQQRAQAETQTHQQRVQGELQLHQHKTQAEIQLAQQKQEAQLMLEMRKLEAELQMASQRLAAEIELARTKAASNPAGDGAAGNRKGNSR